MRAFALITMGAALLFVCVQQSIAIGVRTKQQCGRDAFDQPYAVPRQEYRPYRQETLEQENARLRQELELERLRQENERLRRRHTRNSGRIY